MCTDTARIWQGWKGWKGWKGSVKATHLVIVLYDHFALKATRASYRMVIDRSQPQPSERAETANHMDTIAANALPETPMEDMWVLEYISVNRIQTLMEALDDDRSSFVTVDEVNKFTSRRPEGWR